MASHSRYTKELASIAVAQICQTVGWNSSLSSPLNILLHVMDGYFKELARNIHQYSDHFGHGTPTMEDVVLAFYEMGISGAELENYLENVTPVLPAVNVPAYPVKKESQLRFLKPGSREVVTRPVHVHEHLPAMYPELEEESYSNAGNEAATETFKRPGDPLPVIEPKKIKLEEECLPMREVLSVMMTTSGFLSPAREGKLPESRLPVITSDCRSSSPSSHSYPTVPPEVKGEFKKSKKSIDDANVQKLISMKETSKLNAFKRNKVPKLGDSSSHFKIKSKEHKHHHRHRHHHKKDKYKNRDHKNKEHRDKHRDKFKEKERKEKVKEHENKSKELREKEQLEKELKEKEREAREKDMNARLEMEFELMAEKEKDMEDKKLFSMSPPPTPDVQPDPIDEEMLAAPPTPEPIEKITSEPDKVKLNIFKKMQSKPKDEKDKEKEREKEKEKERLEREKEKEKERLEREKEREKEREREKLEKERERLEREKEREREREREKERERERLERERERLDREKERERLEKEKEREREKERQEKLKKKKEKEMKQKEEDDQEVVRKSAPLFSFPFPSVSGPGLIPTGPGLIPSGPGLIPSGPGLIPTLPQHPLIPKPIGPPITPTSVKSKEKTSPKEKENKIKEQDSNSSTISKPTPTDNTEVKKEKDHTKKDKNKHKKKDKEKIKKKKDKKDKDKEKHKEKDKEKKDNKEKEKIKDKTEDVIKEKIEKPEEKIKKEDKVKEKEKDVDKEKKPKDKDKKLKKEKLKKKKKDKEKSEQDIIPKLTFKFGNDSEDKKRESSPKVVIKPVKSPSPPPAMDTSAIAEDAKDNQVWICPACGIPDDGSPMIGCDSCDEWYHWVCVGLIAEPEASEWYCPKCSKVDKKKRGRKKKSHHDM